MIYLTACFVRLLKGVCFTLIACISFGASASDRPNILFIFSDDHAAHAIGAYGGRLASLNPTPNIDRLANEGVRMANVFCVNSICTPSRATVITGQHSHVHNCKGFANGIEAARQTLPIQMKKAGYETAIIGKWHLIEEPGAFDYYSVLAGQGNYFNPILREKGRGEWPNNERRFAGYDSKHSSDVITDLSLNWLKNRQGSDKPFFLMHQFKAPHDNFENAERYDWLYEDVEIPEPESLWIRGNHGPLDKPQYGTSTGKRNSRRNMGDHMFVDKSLGEEAYKHESYQRYLKKYLRCVKGLDDNIGRLFTYLEETGQMDNTIIIYTADQGFNLGEHDYIDKRWMYEESLRMPFLVRYPARFKAGTVNTDIINNTDFAPTLLELAGVTTMPESFQGRSFVSNLEGNTPGDWPTSSYYRYWLHMAHHDNPAHYGLRTQTHKLIFFYGLPLDCKGALDQPTVPHWELYDLEHDPNEMNNVYEQPQYREIREELKIKLDNEKRRIGDTDDKYPELVTARREHWN